MSLRNLEIKNFPTSESAIFWQLLEKHPQIFGDKSQKLR
jgi:hypothetical protein